MDADGTDLDELIDELARVLHDPDSARELVQRAEGRSRDLPAFDIASAFWGRVIRAAANGELRVGLPAILDQAVARFPDNVVLARYRTRAADASQVVEPDQYDVFLSYNLVDEVSVEEIARRLRDEASLRPFLGIWQLVPGESFIPAIEKALEGSRTIAVFFGPAGMSSWHDEEKQLALYLVTRARQRERRVIPVLLPGGRQEEVEGFLRLRTSVDLRHDGGFARLVAGIEGRAPDPLPDHGPRVVNVGAENVDADGFEPPRDRPCASQSSNFASNEGSVLGHPGLWRALLDWKLPWLHSKLRNLGAVSTPPEYADVMKHLGELHANLKNDIARKTYIENSARPVPTIPLAENDESSDAFVRPIHQVIREILGRSEGGDSANAQLAALNRKSRVVRDLIDTLLMSHEPLVLLGDPGTGKTMTLQYAALDLIASQLQRVFPIVTVYVRLGEFHVEGKAITPTDVLEHVKRFAPSIRGRIEALADAGRLLILFDGLDEMSRERYTEHTSALSKFAGARSSHGYRTKTLFSCRITDFSPSFTHQRLVLLPFDRGQILTYLRRQFPGIRTLEIDDEAWSFRRIAKHLARGDMAFDATNPFVLWLLCFYLIENRTWPKSRPALLGFHLEKTYHRKQGDEREDAEIEFPLHEEALGHWSEYAFLITQRNLGTAIAVHELAALTAHGDRLQTMIRVGHRCGVLVESKDYRAHLVRFDHHRLQEYFTALHIHQERTLVEWFDKLDVPRWQETLVNLVLMGGGEEAARVLAQAIDEAIGVHRANWGAHEEEVKRREEQKKQRDEETKNAKKKRHDAAAAHQEDERGAVAHGDELATVGSLEESDGSGPSSTGSADENPPLVEPMLDHQEELVLADRVELAARVAREAENVKVVEDRLVPALRNAVDFLTVRGNPVTQVKMVRACAHASDPELIEAVRRPMKSKIRWVSDQAMILLSANGRSMGANLPTEIGYDLAAGVLLARLPAYIRAISNSHQRGSIRSLCIGVLCALSFVLLLGLASAATYWGVFQLTVLASNDWWTGTAQELERPQFGVAVAMLTIGVSALAFKEEPELLWLAILGTPVGLLEAIFVVRGLWEGTGTPLLGLFMMIGALVLCLPAISLAVMTLALPGLLLYTSLTKSTERRHQSLYSLCVHAWQRMGFPGRDAAKMFMGILISFSAVIAFLTVLAYLGEWVVELILVTIAMCIAIVLSMWLVRNARSWQRFANRKVLSILGLALVGTAALCLVIFLGWLLFRLIGLYIARFFALLFALVVTVILTKLAIALLRWVAYTTRRRPFPRGMFTPTKWKELVGSADAQRQEDLFFRTRHESLSLTLEEFIQLLVEVCPLVKEEPALSTYWENRAELEQILKQERRG